MQVYAVIGGMDYEGQSFHSLRLFDCKSAAEAYADHLKDFDGYDYAIVETREVCYDSAIVA